MMQQNKKDAVLNKLWQSKKVQSMVNTVRDMNKYDADELRSHVFMILLEHGERQPGFIESFYDTPEELETYFGYLFYFQANKHNSEFKKLLCGSRSKHLKFVDWEFDKQYYEGGGSNSCESREGYDSITFEESAKFCDTHDDCNDEIDRLAKCAKESLAKMNPVAAVYFELYVEHRTYNKVAKIAGVSETNAYRFVQQAIKEIKIQLYGKEEKRCGVDNAISKRIY